MTYQEKDFQREFNKWCKHFINFTAVFELKVTRENSIPFSAVKEHQVYALYAVKHNKGIYKIPDTGFQNPFDSFVIYGAPAYIVVMFHAKHENFYMIPIDEWMEAEKESERKSLTKEQAEKIGIPCSLNMGISGRHLLSIC